MREGGKEGCVVLRLRLRLWEEREEGVVSIKMNLLEPARRKDNVSRSRNSWVIPSNNCPPSLLNHRYHSQKKKTEETANLHAEPDVGFSTASTQHMRKYPSSRLHVRCTPSQAACQSPS